MKVGDFFLVIPDRDRGSTMLDVDSDPWIPPPKAEG